MANLRQYIPLATAGEVISQSFTNANTDPYLISNDTIVMAELAHIKSLLGVKFYGELKQENNNGTLTANNQALMTYYLIPALCWMTRFEVILEIQNNSSSAGVVTNLDEFAAAVSPTELNVYRQSTYRKGQLFLTDMMDYINGAEQAGMFPTYDANKGCSTNEVWKNHGIVMYDSIYDRNWYGTCSSCYSSNYNNSYNNDCNCN
tara:strand:+ start:40 stop:651 length:612 start_codon:yes stop_codon:yes gene_type:complete